MERVELLRRNALFAGSPRGGETAAVRSSLTSTCRRHEIRPQPYLTQLLANLPDTPMSRLDEWLPGRWQKPQAQRSQQSQAERESQSQAEREQQSQAAPPTALPPART